MANAFQESVFENVNKLVDRTKDLTNLNEWSPEERRRALILTAAGASLAWVTYRIGKGQKSAQPPVPIHQAPEAVRGFDFTPVYKLVKLWMLYRIAV